MRFSPVFSASHFPHLALLTALFLAPLSVRAASPAAGEAVLPDAQGLAEMIQRAQQASPRDQCFLYTELVHTMTEIAGREMLSGEVDQASATLRQVEHYAQLIHLGLANDTRRLKNAELLMHRTTYRLNGYLHAASGDDRATLQSTLKQLNQVEDELMTQVFRH